MSALPDPAELAPSRDPAAYGRRPVFTATFFAWISLCLLCLAAGWAVARFGVQLTPAARVEPAEPQAPVRPAAAGPTAPVSPPAALAPGPADGAGVDALAARVARLESSAGHSGDAAAGALAAAALSEAAQSSAPFGQDLAAYQRLLPNSPDLAALAPLAARGAPSRAELLVSLPDVLSAASAAGHQPPKDAGLIQRLGGWIGRVVIIRRVDPGAAGVDGALARAEAQAAAGDLEGAAAALQHISGPARAALAGWTDAADRRIEIDRRIAAIRAQALEDLVQAGGARS